MSGYPTNQELGTFREKNLSTSRGLIYFQEDVF